MAKVDKLEVEVTANTKDLEDGLQRSSKSLATLGFNFEKATKDSNKLSSSTSSLSSTLSGKLTVAAGVAATALSGMVVAMNKMSSGQVITLMSKRLGIATESMQKLSFAARVNGLDSEVLSDAMKDLSVKIKDASLGAKSYEEALRLVGLKSADLVNMPVDQQFLAFAEAISKADDATRRFVLDEINDSMFQLLPLMEKGAKGFEEMGKRAEELGAVLGNVELEQLNEAARKINEMNIAWDSMITKITAKLAPAITALVTELDKATTSTSGGLQSRVSGFGSEEEILRRHRKKRASQGALGTTPVGLRVSGGISKEESNAELGGGFAMGGDLMHGETGGASEELQAAAEYAREKQEAINEAILESQERAAQLEVSLRLQAENDKLKATQDRIDAEIKLEEMKRKAVSSIVGNLSSLMNTESRKMFEVGKAAAAAQATMNTYEGANKAMAQGGIWGWAQAAAIMTAGFNNVNNILSTSFGGAGGGAASTGGAAGLGSDGSTTEAPSVQTTNFDVTLQGDSFSGDQVRGLIGQINEATDDGVKLNAVMVR
jgi:hypothetical protein